MSRAKRKPRTARISDKEREAIADAIRKGGKRNDIARKFGRSPGTVSNIASEFGIQNAFDRTATARASEAKAVDNKAKRVELIGLMYDNAIRMQREMYLPHKRLVHDFTKEGDYVEHWQEVPQRAEVDMRHLASASRANVQSAIELERVDQGFGEGSALDRLWEAMLKAENGG